MRLALASSLCLLMMSCGDSDSDSNDSSPPSNSSDQVSDESPSDEPNNSIGDYKDTSLYFSLTEGLVDPVGSSPHGMNQIFYSIDIQPFVGQSGFEVPVGASAVKEFDSNGDGVVDGLAVMIKQAPGYDPDNGDWYYDYRTASGEIKDSPPAGRIQGCIGCHSVYPEQDYLPGLDLLAN